MLCCKTCPFNPKNTTSWHYCKNPECKDEQTSEHKCTRLPYARCYLDTYVINRLYQKDELAIKLAGLCVKKAVLGRDRAILLCVFQAAPENLRESLWQILIDTEPRSIWLLNPIFQAAGLMPLKEFSLFSNLKHAYYSALKQNPYSGAFYKAVSVNF